MAYYLDGIAIGIEQIVQRGASKGPFAANGENSRRGYFPRVRRRFSQSRKLRANKKTKRKMELIGLVQRLRS